MPQFRLGEQTKQAFKNVSLNCCTNVFILTILLTIVLFTSILINEKVSNGDLQYYDSEFSWKYTPPWPPMNPAYDNYTVLYGTSYLSHVLIIQIITATLHTVMDS